MTAKKITLGLIGAGRIGRVHADTVARVPGARLTMVADIIEDAAKQAATHFGIPTVSKDYHDILNNPEVDAVIICSSTDTHAQIIQEAANAHKHIFCEKPIALDLAKIDRALEAVDKAGVKLMVGFNRRFDPNFRRVRQAITSDEIGDVHLMHIISRDPAPPPLDYVRVSGGIFLDMTIHDFDMARFLMGSEVNEVYAVGGVRIDPAIGQAGDIDTAFVVLKFDNGAIGTIDNSRKAVYGYDQRVEVFGSKGAIQIGNNYPNTALLSTAESIHHDLPLHFFMQRYTEAYREELTAFVVAIQNDRPVPVTGRDGRLPVVIGQAAWRSYREGLPVKLK